MIENDEQLSVVRLQLGRVELALESLARRMLPKGRSQYEAFSVAYLDQIAELQREIDKYLAGRPTVSPTTARAEAARDPATQS